MHFNNVKILYGNFNIVKFYLQSSMLKDMLTTSYKKGNQVKLISCKNYQAIMRKCDWEFITTTLLKNSCSCDAIHIKNTLFINKHKLILKFSLH